MGVELHGCQNSQALSGNLLFYEKLSKVKYSQITVYLYIYIPRLLLALEKTDTPLLPPMSRQFSLN